MKGNVSIIACSCSLQRNVICGCRALCRNMLPEWTILKVENYSIYSSIFCRQFAFNLTELVCRNDKNQKEDIVCLRCLLPTLLTFVGKVDFNEFVGTYVQKLIWAPRLCYNSTVYHLCKMKHRQKSYYARFPKWHIFVTVSLPRRPRKWGVTNCWNFTWYARLENKSNVAFRPNKSMRNSKFTFVFQP